MRESTCGGRRSKKWDETPKGIPFFNNPIPSHPDTNILRAICVQASRSCLFTILLIYIHVCVYIRHVPIYIYVCVYTSKLRFNVCFWRCLFIIYESRCICSERDVVVQGRDMYSTSCFGKTSCSSWFRAALPNNDLFPLLVNGFQRSI